jgi:transposase
MADDCADPSHTHRCAISPHGQDLGGLVEEWAHLDERIENVTDEIEGLARTDVSCGRLMTVPGIGPIIASAMVAAIGHGASFAKGVTLPPG